MNPVDVAMILGWDLGLVEEVYASLSADDWNAWVTEVTR